MSPQNSLTKRLKISRPIFQAPMGGAVTPELAAAVSNSGGLGFIAAAYLSPDHIVESVRQLRSLSPKPFGINLFAPAMPDPLPVDIAPALNLVNTAHQNLKLPPVNAPAELQDDFEAKLAACLTSDASIISFTFGIPPQTAIEAIKANGMFIMGTATTVKEAQLLEQAGFEAVVAQGSEAGAHRGSFAAAFEDAMIGTIALVPQMVDAIDIPVVASGGIMDGRGIAAALVLGASAVQLGTAFLSSHEAGISEVHKRAILAANEDETRMTRAFSGRPARGIQNLFMHQTEAKPEAVLPYPYQNQLTRLMRQAAAEQGESSYLSLWAGQGLRLAKRQSAAELVQRLAEETQNAIANLS